jgi:hypothetical protein
VGLVFSALLLLALFWRLGLRRRMTPKAKAKADPRLPPHEEALGKLKALEASGALDAPALKPTYLDMSEIFRDYLGRRFGFSSLDLTTSEMRTRLEAAPGCEEWQEAIFAWLSRCDLIKYANSAADPDEARDALYRARRLIESTKEKPEPQKEAARA